MLEYYNAPLAYHPEIFDVLMTLGFRRFGNFYARWFEDDTAGIPMKILPLRINLKHFKMSKSQQKLFRKNSERFSLKREKAVLDQELDALFLKHREKFTYNLPPSLDYYVGEEARKGEDLRVDCLAFKVYDGQKLVAVSFLDYGVKTASALYAMNDPDYNRYSLGIFTMLAEINHCISDGFQHYHLGHVHEGSSFYDYKKRFYGTEYLDKETGEWRYFERVTTVEH
jgi:arginine-tRNA-protein transferase